MPYYLRNKLGALSQPFITMAVVPPSKSSINDIYWSAVESGCLIDVDISANRNYSPFQ